MRKMRKLFAITLVILMLAGAFNIGVVAEEETPQSQNIWYGDEIKVEVAPRMTRSGGYSFMSVQPSGHCAYEMSHHMVSYYDGTKNDIPQLLAMVPVLEQEYEWTPNGPYLYGSSNYEVLYCCDAETGYEGGYYYKRLNLEDSDYYNEQQAAHIRAIVTNSYPYVTLDVMKDTLKANGFEDADKLTRSEIISAVQSAIWSYSNNGVYDLYTHTFDVSSNPAWGGVIHDYTAETLNDYRGITWSSETGSFPEGKRVFATNDEVDARISALVEHLKNLTPIAAPDNQIVISKLTVTDVVPAETESEIYNVNIDVRLDSSGSDSEKDNIVLNVYVDGVLAENAAQKVVKGTDVYTVNVQAKAGQQIKAVVSGTQYVERGVYFYEPEGGRDVSQCLVGVSEGKTDVYAEETVTIDGFVPKTADLTITKIIDGHMYSPEDSFVFTVRKNNDPSFVMNVVLNEFTKTENKEEYTASVTIKGLPEAVYKVTENTDWSWRYTPAADGDPGTDDAVKVIDLYKENEVTFVNHMLKTNWLTGEDSAENQWEIAKVPETLVTLEVPGEIEGNMDVVFILGGGMTANMETIESAINVFKPSMESGKATVRVGIISLEKGQEIILDLNDQEAVLNPDTYIDFITEKFDSINDLPEGTTNLHSQLLEAQKMLAKETTARDEDKYVFVLATGRTYWFDDAKGEQATIVNNVNNTYYWADYLWRSQRGGHTSLYMIPDRYNDSYEAFFDDIEKWVKADEDKYVFTPHFDINDPSAYANWYAKNNKDLRDLGIAGSRYGLGIVNPVPTAENFITGVPAAIGSGGNPQNALNYERAQYECVQVWEELISKGYNCYAICSETPFYQNGSEYIAYAGYTGTSNTQLGHSFMNYLANLAGHGEAPTVWDYERDENGNILADDLKNADVVLQENFFAPIEEAILYTCSLNSTVEVKIGYDEDRGNFEFVDEAEEIKLTVGGVEYSTEKVETKEKATSSYEFRYPEKEATFWLDYYYGDGKGEEHFIWTLGENMSFDNKATLTYKLKLLDIDGVIDEAYLNVDLSEIATLNPVDSNGNGGEALNFPINP